MMDCTRTYAYIYGFLSMTPANVNEHSFAITLSLLLLCTVCKCFFFFMCINFICSSVSTCLFQACSRWVSLHMLLVWIHCYRRCYINPIGICWFIIYMPVCRFLSAWKCVYLSFVYMQKKTTTARKLAFFCKFDQVLVIFRWRVFYIFLLFAFFSSFLCSISIFFNLFHLFVGLSFDSTLKY